MTGWSWQMEFNTLFKSILHLDYRKTIAQEQDGKDNVAK